MSVCFCRCRLKVCNKRSAWQQLWNFCLQEKSKTLILVTAYIVVQQKLTNLTWALCLECLTNEISLHFYKCILCMFSNLVLLLSVLSVHIATWSFFLHVPAFLRILRQQAVLLVINLKSTPGYIVIST